MKAVRYHQYGGPEVLQYEDAPKPEVGADEILIKVSATAFNPADALLRMGAFEGIVPLEFPCIPNMDVSGTIDKVGASVTGFNLGERVFACLEMGRNGAAAEYVACKATIVTSAPKTIQLEDAAAIPSGALTAWQGLFDHGHLQSGQRVLITAAAGGVGSIAVQLAKWGGAYVIGTASNASFSALEALNIDEIINYKSESVEDKLTEKVDLILNLAPISSEEVTKMLFLLKEGGTLVSALHPADANIAQEQGVHVVRMAVQRNANQLSQIADLVDMGYIKPLITEKKPLNELAAVHARQGQTRGKILLLINNPITE
jgi:NADPH:quinone reductase-like Zn-dependent oxidoreductase